MEALDEERGKPQFSADQFAIVGAIGYDGKVDIEPGLGARAAYNTVKSCADNHDMRALTMAIRFASISRHAKDEDIRTNRHLLVVHMDYSLAFR